MMCQIKCPYMSQHHTSYMRLCQIYQLLPSIVPAIKCDRYSSVIGTYSVISLFILYIAFMLLCYEVKYFDSQFPDMIRDLKEKKSS